MPVNINYAPVGAMALTGYQAGLGQYRQWQQQEAQRQQQMLLEAAQKQQQLAAQQQMEQANINMTAPLRQAQAAYYNDRGNYYGARADLSLVNKALRATWSGENPAGAQQPPLASTPPNINQQQANAVSPGPGQQPSQVPWWKQPQPEGVMG